MAKAKPTPAIPRSLLRRVTDTCGKASDALDRCVDRVSDMLDKDSGGDYDKDLASHLAWLTKNLAQIGGEVRKMESHEAKQDLTDATLVDHFRKLTPDRRAQWVRDIMAMDRKGSVLG